jgi:hypothetical protein
MKTKYVIVTWPESQKLMDHPRFDECHLICDDKGIKEYWLSAFFVPENLFNELYKI